MTNIKNYIEILSSWDTRSKFIPHPDMYFDLDSQVLTHTGQFTRAFKIYPSFRPIPIMKQLFSVL